MCSGAATLCAERLMNLHYSIHILRITNNSDCGLLNYEVDPCPNKSRFNLCPIRYFDIWLLTFILTKDKDWSTEYIGVPPPCIVSHT